MEGTRKTHDYRCKSCKKLLFRGLVEDSRIEIKCRFCHLLNQFSPASTLDVGDFYCPSDEAQLIAAAFEASQDHIIITNDRALILYANKAVEQNTGFALSEVIGKNPRELWGGHMPRIFYEKMWHIIKEEKKPFVGEVHNKTKIGMDLTQELRISPILNEAGKIRFFLGVELNVTAREQSRKEKQEIASAIVHQFKTPLTATRWLLDTLLEARGLTEQQRQRLKDIYSYNLNLVTLMDCLLTISRIDANDWAKTENVDIIAEVKNIVSEAQRQYAHLKISFESPEEKAPLLANKTLVAQVFANIINNAAEYSPKAQGEVHIVLKNDAAFYYFSCQDRGIGIPKEEQKNIFSKFFRASNAATTKKGGTGLGLYIVKLVADSFGWSVSFKSAMNKGTTFFIKIPKNVH